MKKNLYFIALLAIVCVLPVTAQKVTGFSDLKLFLDPGHYGTYNMGYGNYSEAEKVLIVAHDVKDFLVTYTDMKPENIQLSRLNDSDPDVTLSNRVAAARTMGAHFLYSIHSDAPSTTAYSSLLLYGGRRLVQNGPIIEKTPEGGKQYGDILVGDLTSVLRAIRSNGDVRSDNSRGNLGDWGFYYSDGRTGGPYLGMNNHTACPSLLSEAGFHTNPAQNMQFVNREHKRMQAYSAYQSLVKYLSEKHLGGRINPVQIGIATGFVFDNETMAPVNGAKITITEGETVKTYTTDTYASLPKKYSFKPEEFGNGFYWIEGFTPGATVNIKVEATGFETQETTLTIPTTIGATTIDGLGVKDFKLLNEMPAKVKNVATTNDLSGKVIQRYPMNVVFDRKMDKATVEAAVSFSPEAAVTFSWPNDFTLRIDITQIAFETEYTLKIDGSIAKNSVTNDFLDGNGDGTPGGDFTRVFTTGDLDQDPPKVVSYDPQGIQEEAFRPIVRIEFDEYLNELSFGHTPIVVTDKDGNSIDGYHTYHAVATFKSVMHFFFYEDLLPQEKYTVTLAEGIADMYGNATETPFTFEFTAKPRTITQKQIIADFAAASWGTTGWWQPLASGTTTGINVDLTSTSAKTDVAYSSNSTSMRIDYLFESASGVIRVHRRSNPSFTKAANTQMQYYLFGDGSNATFRLAVRPGTSDGSGAIWSCTPFTLNWVGWKLMTWDLFDNAKGQVWLAGDGAIAVGTQVDVKAIGLHPSNPLLNVPSYILIDEITALVLGDYIPGSNTGVEGITAEDGIEVSTSPDFIKISANTAINDVKVYSITGALLKSIQPGQPSLQIPTNDLAQGVYIVKVATKTLQENVKVFVK